MSASTSLLSAKAVSLRVRPFGVSHLCFETDGILGDLNLTLNPTAAGLLGAVRELLRCPEPSTRIAWRKR